VVNFILESLRGVAMNELEKLAEQIAVDSDIDPQAKFGSVIAVIMLIGVFLTLIRVIQDCNKSELKVLNNNEQKCTAYASHIKNLSIRRSWFTKMRLKKILRQNMPMEDYRKHGGVLCEKILDAATNLNHNQVHSLIEVSNV
jgi:hypothetical protein|tara:strand:+ start:1532 stop:1957 length:426 start_codon:yes stop_codon:yes gene_type:complete